MIYRFRVILDNDTDEDIFRDLEIQDSDTLEDLHNIITQSFGFDGSEMASFYISNKNWEQGEEISLFDMSDEEELRLMNETVINSIVDKEHTRLIYMYDFYNMWTFFVELAEIVEETEGHDYPNLIFAQGQLPELPPQKNFENEDEDYFEDFDDDLDPEDMEGLDFDENWN